MQITEQQALQKLAHLCSQSEHCQQDIIAKMQKWDLPEEAQAGIMEQLISERYLDEARYSRAFIHDKREYNHWGPCKIEQALRMKGISRDHYAPALADIDEDEWLSILRPLLQQKRRTVKGRNDYEVTQKLLRFAVGRGFTYDQALASLQ